MKPREQQFWEMVRTFMKLDQVQSAALYERMWLLDIAAADARKAEKTWPKN